MPDKPSSSDGYGFEQLQGVHRTCLYMAAKLGDLLDEIVVVGGLVPYLLIDQENLPAGESSAYPGMRGLLSASPRPCPSNSLTPAGPPVQADPAD